MTTAEQTGETDVQEDLEELLLHLKTSWVGRTDFLNFRDQAYAFTKGLPHAGEMSEHTRTVLNTAAGTLGPLGLADALTDLADILWGAEWAKADRPADEPFNSR